VTAEFGAAFGAAFHHRGQADLVAALSGQGSWVSAVGSQVRR
jgi:hypothetical protein